MIYDKYMLAMMAVRRRPHVRRSVIALLGLESVAPLSDELGAILLLKALVPGLRIVSGGRALMVNNHGPRLVQHA